MLIALNWVILSILLASSFQELEAVKKSSSDLHGPVLAVALVLASVSIVPLLTFVLASLPKISGATRTRAVCGVAESVVAIADMLAVLAPGEGFAGSVAVVARKARLAHAGPCPWMAPERI